MNIEDLRNFCLSLEGVTEKTPFGKFSRRYESTLVFYVLDHVFCMADMDDFTDITFRSTPDEIEELRSRYMSIQEPVNTAMKFWVRVILNEDMRDSEIYSNIKRAYEIVRNKYTKKNIGKEYNQ